MRKMISLGIVLLATTCLIGLAWADSTTREEVVSKCEQAAKVVKDQGIFTAIQAIGDKEGPFVWKDTYVFLMDLDGKMLAHPMKPELTKQDTLIQVKDTAGKPLFLEFIQIAHSKGSGWVDYMWPKPGQDQPVPKSSYILRVPDTQYFVGAGIYQ